MVWLISYFLLQPSSNAFAVDFRKEQLHISGQILTVEIADNQERREQGFMFRKSLKDTEGMLFIFDSEQTLNFWMKNTLIDLAIGYFDKNKKLIDIQEMKAAPMVVMPPPYPSKQPAMYALEVPKLWFHRKSVKLGSTFSLGKEGPGPRPGPRSSP